MKQSWIGVAITLMALAAPPVETGQESTVAAVEPAPTSGNYQPIGPIRLADTRQADCGCTKIDDKTIAVEIASHPEVPKNTLAVAVTITATASLHPGFVTAYPGGTERPDTSTLNTRTDRVIANSTIVPVSSDGTIEVFRLAGGDIIIDLAGAFVTASSSTAGRYQAITPTRLLDTRDGSSLVGLDTVDVKLPDAIPADATAAAINVTAINNTSPGYISAFGPDGDPGPDKHSSFLNVSGDRQPVAASTIVPVTDAGIVLYNLSGGDMTVDITGWFTGPSADSSANGLFVPGNPQRLLDTRQQPYRVYADGTIEVPSPVEAAALVTNLTATQADWPGFVTAYPAGTLRPTTSALNMAGFNDTRANLAITPTSVRGLGYYSLAGTDLLVDLLGYFTGLPADAIGDVPPNIYRAPRVLVIGDSALAGIDVYTGSHAALSGLDIRLDLFKCRKLVKPSCISPTVGIQPPTALEVINNSPGPYDIIYINVGHNEWYDAEFGSELAQIMAAARNKGAKTVLWANFYEHPHTPVQQTAFISNNQQLRYWSERPEYPDLIIADWNNFVAPHPEWLADGIHFHVGGAYGHADFIARWVMAIMHQPCLKPLTVGGAVSDPCPVPELAGPPPDVISLYR